MSLETVTIALPAEQLKLVDEIAANLEVDREAALREAILAYLADYEELKAEAAEADRQFEAGETLSHEDVVAKYEAWKASMRASGAA